MRQSSFIHEFVETVPEDLEEGRLYISTRFRTASHLCACGCGCRVVTPIKPAKWRFTFDGETVSLHPSIGRWQVPCRSHYWILRNKVQWSEALDDRAIEAVLRKDASDLHDYYESRATPESRLDIAGSWWRRLLRRVR